MRLILTATALTASLIAGPASARIILTETNCPQGQHVVLAASEEYHFADSGKCREVSEPPYQIKFKDGRVEEFDTDAEYEQRRNELMDSIEG